MLYRMRQRRGTAAEWATKNPVLGAGEFGVESDSDIIKLGDGVRAWNDLPIALSSVYLQFGGGSVNADTLDGHDSTEYVLAGDFDTRTLPNSAVRKLIAHWGSLTSFPMVGVLPGDTCIRSDVGTNGSLWTFIGGSSGRSGWVHKGAIICTSTNRPLSTDTNPVVYEGLKIYETDTKLIRYYNGLAYVSNLMARGQIRANVASPAYSANVWQTLSFNIADYDTNGMWTTLTPTRLTCKQAGDYLISGHVQLGGFVAMAARIIKNGVVFPYSYGMYGNGLSSAEVSARLITLAVNDYLELQANVGVNGWATVVATDSTTFLNAMRIG